MLLQFPRQILISSYLLELSLLVYYSTVYVLSQYLSSVLCQHAISGHRRPFSHHNHPAPSQLPGTSNFHWDFPPFSPSQWREQTGEHRTNESLPSCSACWAQQPSCWEEQAESSKCSAKACSNYTDLGSPDLFQLLQTRDVLECLKNTATRYKNILNYRKYFVQISFW